MKIKKQRKIVDFKKQYKEAGSYVRESRHYIFFVIALFILCVIIGIVFADYFAIYLQDVLKKLVGQTENMNGGELMFFILQNNFKSALFAVLGGIILGIYPFINVIVNGVLVGFVLERVVDAVGFSAVWRLFPHGIFELPAIFVAFGIGIRLGTAIFNEAPWKELKRRFYHSMNVLLFVVLPLLIVAAVIEGLLIAFGA